MANGGVHADDQAPGFTANTIPRSRPLIRGRGIEVFDGAGRRFLDFCSQTLNTNLGHCHPAITEAIVSQATRIQSTSSRFLSDAAIELRGRLLELLPASLSRLNLACGSGSMANECALKAVRKRTGRHKVLALSHSHHGQSMETMRVSGKHWNRDYLGGRGAVFVDPPYCFRCPWGESPESCSVQCLDAAAAELEQMPQQFACVIVEPIMVDGGILAPPKKYHARLRQLCDEYCVSLVWDEVQTAFGWLGTIFAMDSYGIVPDVVTLGKGLGAGLPLAGAAFKPDLDVLEYGEHEFTAAANPIACAAALAMLAVLCDSNLMASAMEQARHLRKQLELLQARHGCLGDIRGLGLIVGVEVVDATDGSPDGAAARTVGAELERLGILVRMSKVGQQSNVLQVKPPLVLSRADVDEFVAALQSAVELAERST